MAGNPLADARRELNETKEQLRRIQASADAALESIREWAERGRMHYALTVGRQDQGNVLPALKGFTHIEQTAIAALKVVRK